MSSRSLALVLLLGLAACAEPAARPPTPASPPNLDAATQALIAQAQRVVFVVPFSHWDTDWHDTFGNYSTRSDGNILAAIQMAQQDPQYRYTFEQVLFVQHFWDGHPEARVDLKTLVQRRQLTFAWAGITQPETSLTAPDIQVRNVLQGQDWIAATFGAEYVPHSAWQSDAFGNSAALQRFLNQFGIPYLFIGRWQARCDPDYEKCNALPEAFYWHSPATPDDPPILVAYLSYPSAWDAIHRLPTPDQQLAALRTVIENEYSRTTGKYVFLPMGSDFIDPLPNLPDLVRRWNVADKQTVLVMADPETAFQYLATQKLPGETVDFNPIWQGFYASRPGAKIADKESEFFLTAGDKFGLVAGQPESSAWYTATMNAHYDNIGAVSFDSVWESTQRPRFEQTVAMAADDLASSLARLAAGIQAPLVVFNPTSWARSEVVELQGNLPDLAGAPTQALGPAHVAVRVHSAPAIGWTSGESLTHPAVYPAQAGSAGGNVTLSNGLVSVTLDASHGGTFSGLKGSSGKEQLGGPGDEVVYWHDNGDIYGAFFDQQQARESGVTATVTTLAAGPLLARAQAVFSLGGQALTKTVTVRVDSPLVEVALEIKALPTTSAVLMTPTTLQPQDRTDDLGFVPFTHPVYGKPIASGDVTYRREIFHPVTAWSDFSANGEGLALITHGLQGVGGLGTFETLLVRSATDSRDGEGVTDPDYHTLRYAYLPQTGSAADAQPWLAAYAFNQPLIPAWRVSGEVAMYTRFGPPEVLQLGQAPKPAPKAKEVLIRVHATTVCKEDPDMRAAPGFNGLLRPRHPILGQEFAGKVEAVGPGASRFGPGDRVYGIDAFGAYAEYECLSEDATLARMPAGLSYAEAASVPNGALTALPFLRDYGQIRRGQKVLVYGASGSVGTAAVQLAKHHFGAEVTGVCSTPNLELVRSLGASRVVDYTREDFTRLGQTYNLIFDAVGKLSFSRCWQRLAEDGVYLTVIPGPGVLLRGLWASLAGGRQARFAATGLRPARQKAEDLCFIRGLIEAGQFRPVIDRRYPLEQIAAAHHYVQGGHKKGNVVITIG